MPRQDHWDATARRRAAVHAAYTDSVFAKAAAATQPLVLDIAWERPALADILATGATGVMRYSSPDSSKNWTSQEVIDYRAAGLGCGVVFESTAGRATAGYAAGQADARQAVSQVSGWGFPAQQPVHFAVDSDVTWAAVAAYFEGCASVLGKARTGAYGGYKIAQGAHGYGLNYVWQTVAWSQGQVSPYARLYQNGGTLLSGAADTNRVLAADGDWGQYTGAAMSTPLSPTDIANIWSYTETNAATGQPVRMATVLRYEDQNRNNQTASINGHTDSAVASLGPWLAEVNVKIDALTAAVAALETTGLTDAQVQSVANAVADVLAARLAE